MASRLHDRRIERMNDLPPDLLRLRTLRTWHAMWVTRLDEAIAEAERVEAEGQRRQERAAQPPPEWVAQRGVGAGPPTIHTTLGEADACWDAVVDYARVRPITRAQALRALADEGAQACIQCRPDTVLGLP